MVCIIDDREDVWDYAKNLVCVKPYVYFKNTGDINEPIPKFLIKNKNDSKIEKQDSFIKEADNESASGFESEKEESSQIIDNNKENEHQRTSKCTDATCSSSSSSSKECENNEKEDDYLISLEDILKNVHHEYYHQYDERNQALELSDNEDDEINESDLPDMKKVLPKLLKNVLKDCVITFSGVVPTDYDLFKQKCCIMALALGAKVNKELIFGNNGNGSKDHLETTHLVAANYGTSKVREALKIASLNRNKKQLFIVQPEWLIECYQKWSKCDEKDFLLNEDYEYKNCLFHQEYNVYQQRKAIKQQKLLNNSNKTESSPSKRPSSENYKATKKQKFTKENVKFTLGDDDDGSNSKLDDIDNNFDFIISNNELDIMDKEVDAECSNADSDKNSEDNNNNNNNSKENAKSEHSLSSSSSSSSSLSDSSTTNSDDDEGGSLDDEMVKAIERQLE